MYKTLGADLISDAFIGPIIWTIRISTVSGSGPCMIYPCESIE